MGGLLQQMNGARAVDQGNIERVLLRKDQCLAESQGRFGVHCQGRFD